MRDSRVIRWLIAAVVGLAAFAVAPAVPARAASCFGSSCDGKYPGELGCRDDRVAMTSFEIYNPEPRLVTFFYSKACHAMWTEHDDPGSGTYWTYKLFLYWQPQYGTAREQLAQDAEGGHDGKIMEGSTWQHSVMLNLDYSIKFCTDSYSGNMPRKAGDPDLDPTTADLGRCSRWQ